MLFEILGRIIMKDNSRKGFFTTFHARKSRYHFLCLFLSYTLALNIVFQNLAFAADQIIIDHKTLTTLDINGNVTDVRTGTINGQNAFNSFDRFNVNSGNTVNLHVPGSAVNLLNLVHSEKTTVNGILNSIKNGAVGGNVFFANPYGFVVGSGGVVNVGTLTAVTPTKTFMDEFFLSSGVPDPGAVTNLLTGSFPISDSGVISIEGKVNAIEDITLRSGNIENSGNILSGAVFNVSKPDFSEVININGLDSGAAIVEKNGTIEIVALDKVTNSGVIASQGGNNVDGGDIHITAGQTIAMNGDALVSAREKGTNSQGGDITLSASNTDALPLLPGLSTSILLDNTKIEGKSISLTAGSSTDSLAGYAPYMDVDAKINISNNSRLKASGGDITLTARAEQKSPDLFDTSLPIPDDVGIFEYKTTSASVSITDSEITAENSIDINTSSTMAAEVDGFLTLPINAAIVRGKNSAKTLIDGNSELTADTGGIDIATSTDTKTQALAQAVSGESLIPATGTLAVSVVDTRTESTLGGNATAKAANGTVSLKADTRLVSDTVSSGYLLSGGTGAGVAAAIAVVNNTTRAGITDNAKILESAAAGITANAKIQVNTSAETAINDGKGALQDAVTAIQERGYLSETAANEISTFIDKAGDMRNDGQKDEGSGGIQVAGAFAYTGLDNDTQAYAGYADSDENIGKESLAGIKSSGILDVQSHSLVSASNLSSGLASGGDVSIGAGVSILNAGTFNSAHVGRQSADAVEIVAGGLNVSALSRDFDPEDPDDINKTNTFSSLAYSGSGSDGVGIAGALALNFVDSTTRALVGGKAALMDMNKGDVTVTAENNTKNSVVASGNADDDEYSLVGDLFDVYDTLNKGTQNDPEEEDPDAPLGIGASVAVNILENSTTAFIADNAALNNINKLFVSALSENESGTEATSGASGGIALVPVVAFSSTLDVTDAYIGSGPGVIDLEGTGQTAAIQADHKGAVKVTAEGDASDAATAAIGAAVALNFGEDYTRAYTKRGLTSDGPDGSVAIRAVSQNSYETSSTAGAKGAGDEDKPEEGSLNKMVSDFYDMKDKFSKKSKTKEKKEAKTEEGKLSIGAAISLTDADSDTRAYTDAGSTQKIKAGHLTIESLSNTDGTANADASATGSKANFGIGVAINAVKTANRAYINGNSLIEADGIALNAATKSFEYETEDEDGNSLTLTDDANAFNAEAAAGASLGLVSVAGGVGINAVTNTTQTYIGTDSRVEKGGNVSILSQNSSASHVKAQGTVGEDTKPPSQLIQDIAIDALANLYRNSSKNRTGTATTPPSKGKTTGQKKKKSPSIGVGAGVAINSIDSSTRSFIDRDAVLNGLENLTVKASAESQGATQAMAGTDPEPDDTKGTYGIAIDAAVAVSTLSNTTEAVIYSDKQDWDAAAGNVTDNKLSTTGKINVAADGSHTSTVQTNGLAAGDAAIGASVAVAANENTTRAAIYRNIHAGTDLEVDAQQTSMDTTEALAVARGLFVERLQAKLNADPAHKPKSSSTLEQKDVKLDQGVDEKGNKKGKSTSISMAAAAGVTTARNTTQAYVGRDTASVDAHDIAISSGQAMDIKSTGNASYSTRGSGASVFSDIGIGVGVAVTSAQNTTSADIGDHTKITHAQDINVKAASSQNTNQAFFDAMASPNPYDPDTYDPTNPGTPKILSSDKYITTEAIAGAGAAKVALAGSAAVTLSDNLTRASLGQGVEITKADVITIDSQDKSRLSSKAWAVTVAAGKSGGQKGGDSFKVAAGAAGAVLNSNNRILSSIGDNAKILEAEALNVRAYNNKVSMDPYAFIDNLVTADFNNLVNFNPDEEKSEDLISLGKVNFNFDDLDPTQIVTKNNYYTEAAAGSVSDGTLALSGAFSVAVIGNTIEAGIGNGTDITITGDPASGTGHAAVEAKNDYQARALAGSVAAAKKVGAGVSNADIITNDITRASLGGKLTTENQGDIQVDAQSTQDLAAASVAGAGGGKAGLAGAASVVVTDNTVEAKINENAEIKADGSLRVAALDRLTSFMIAGSGAGGGDAGIGGSASVLVSDDSIDAYIDKNADVTALGNGTGLSVLPDDADNADKINGLIIAADGTETIVNLGASGAGGGKAGLAGSATVDILTRDTLAHVNEGVKINTDNSGATDDQDILIAARDKTLAVDIAGTGAGGGKIGASGAADVMVVNKNTKAYMASSAQSVTSANTRDSISVNAANKEDLISIAASGAGGGSAGIAGAVSTQVVTNTTQAWIGNSAEMDAQGNIALSAQDDTNVKNVAVQGSGGGQAGVGGSVGLTTIVNTIEAYVDDNAKIAARGKKDARQVYTGELGGTFNPFKLVAKEIDNAFDDETQPDLSDWALTADVGLITEQEKKQDDHKGLSITAFSTEDVDSIVAGGSFGGSAGVAGAVSVKVIQNDTLARLGKNVEINSFDGIDHADNTNDNASQDVVVMAADHTDANGYVGTATGGGSAGVGGASDVSVIVKNTTAEIDRDARINVKNDILVNAVASENLDSFTAGLGGGGSASVQGAGALAVISNNTRAYTARGVLADAGRDIRIKAEDVSEVFQLSGAIGGAGGGAVGGSAAVSVIEKDTVASVGESTNGFIDASGSKLNAGGETLVEGYSKEHVDTFTISGGGAGTAAVFGAAAVKIMKADTVAAIGRNADVNQNDGFASKDQKVTVTAADDVTLFGVGAGIGGAGAAGIGFTADVGIVRNGTSAYIGDHSTVSARRQAGDSAAGSANNINVSATSEKRAFSLTVAGGGAGAAGIGGAASIISMGGKLENDALKALEGTVDNSSGSLAGILDSQNTGSKIGNDMGDAGNDYEVGSSGQSVKGFVDQKTDRTVSSDINESSDTPLSDTSVFIADATVKSDGDIRLKAKDTTTTLVTAGGVGGAGAAGIGGAAAVVMANNSTSSKILSGATVSAAKELEVRAESLEDMNTNTVAIGGAGAAGIAGTLILNTVYSGTEAKIEDNAFINSEDNRGETVKVDAVSDTNIITVGGNAGGAGAAAAGGTADINIIKKQITASVGKNARVYASKDIRVSADSLERSAAGIFAGRGAGGAAVNGLANIHVIDNDTRAFIDTGALVDSDGNILISAQDDAQVKAVQVMGGGAGGAAVGGSIDVTTITSRTKAYIEDNAVIHARGNADDMDVFTGRLNKELSVGFLDKAIKNIDGFVDQAKAFGDGRVSGNDDDKIFDQKKGLAVTAGSSEDVFTVAAGFAVAGGAGVVGTGSVSVISTDTDARIGDNATLNETRDIAVRASENTNYFGTGITLAGGAGSVSGSFEGAIIDKTTRAHVGASDIIAAGDIDIDAYSSDDINVIAANFGAGGVAVGGAAGVVPVTGKTYAYVEGGADIAADGSLGVLAGTDTQINIVSGGVKIGAAGAGASAGVNVITSDTQAHIGYNPYDQTGGKTRTNAKGLTQVEARSTADVYNRALTAAVTGAAGLAISVGANVVNTQTRAAIADNAEVNQDIAFYDDNQAVKVAADNSVSIDTLSGGGGAGGLVGVGGGIDLSIIRNTTTARIGKDAKVHAQKDVSVMAHSDKKVDSVAAGVGLSGNVGLAGSFSFISIGSELEGEQTSRFDRKNITKVDQMMSGSSINTNAMADPTSDKAGKGLYISDHMKSASAVANSRTSGLGIGTQVDQAGADSMNKTQAMVDEGASVTSGKDALTHKGISIEALDETRIHIESGAVAVGGIAAAGGAVGVAIQKNYTEAVADNAVLSTDGDILISARGKQKDDKSSEINTKAGVAGGIVGVGASVAYLDSKNTTVARLGNGSVVKNADTLKIEADQQTQVMADALGTSIGGGAVGASIAHVDVSNKTQAHVESGTEIGREFGGAVQNVKITANADESATVTATAGAAGIISGSGADADARMQSQVLAYLDKGASVWARKNMDVTAMASPYAEAISTGVAVSLLGSIGISLAEADVDQIVEAWIGENSFINSDNIHITAEQNSATAHTNSFGAGGGLLVGTSATESHAANTSSVTSRVGKNSRIGALGNVKVDARENSNQKALVSGLNVGIVAAGSNKALAESDTTTLAYVDDGVTFTLDNSLEINAQGSDTNYAQAISGSGGLVSIGPKAADAQTVTNSKTAAFIGKGVTSEGTGLSSIALSAGHDSNFNSSADSFAASLLGLTGAWATNTGEALVKAGIGESSVDIFQGFGMDTGEALASLENTDITAADVTIITANRARKDLLSVYNVNAGSGGLFTGAAARSQTAFNAVTDIVIGDGTQLTVDVPDLAIPDDARGFISLAAENDIILKDRVRLDSGGAIALAKSESLIDNPVNTARVTFGENTKIESDGDIDASARIKTEIRTSANAKTYGGAGAAQGLSRSLTNAVNKIDIKDNALVKARGNIRLMAGQNKENRTNEFQIFANTDLFNKTAFPIETRPDADASVTQSDIIHIGENAAMESVGNISLLTEKGNMAAKGYGVGKDLYREVLAAIGSFFSNLFGGGDVSLDIIGGSTKTSAATTVSIDGKVEVGTEHIRKVTINEDGTLDEENTSTGLGVNYDDRDLNENFEERIQTLEALVAALDARINGGNPDAYTNPGAADQITALGEEKTTTNERIATLQNERRPTAVVEKTARESQVVQNEQDITDYKKDQEGLDPDSQTYKDLQALIDAKEAANENLGNEIQSLVENIAQIDEGIEELTARLTEIDTEITALAESQIPASTDESDLAYLKQKYEIKLALLKLQKDSIGDTAQTVAVAQEITARSGNITIKADNLVGSSAASLIAPGDPTIEVINKSPLYLVTNKMTIPDEAGGNIYFNTAKVSTKAEINQRNTSGTALFNSDDIQSTLNSVPRILVENNYAQRTPSDPKAPGLFVDQDIWNFNGKININNIEGSIMVADNVKVTGDDVQIIAGGDLFLGYTDGFKNVYYDREIQTNWKAVTDQAESGPGNTSITDPVEDIDGLPDYREHPALIAGNSVFIAADNLNINGIIQSGIALKEITITDEVMALADQILADYLAGVGEAVVRIDDAAYLPENKNFLETMPLWFNAEDKVFEIGSGQIKGGHMELYGNIMNTGRGELKLMDGYGRISIDNPSSYAVKLSSLDTGSGMEGILKITDFAKKTASGQTLITVTQRIGDNILTFNNDNDTGLLDLENEVNTLYNQSETIYQPRENQYYSWTIKEGYEWTDTQKQTDETWFFFFGGSDSKTSYGSPQSGTKTVYEPIDGYTLRVVDGHDETYWYERTIYTDTGEWGNWSAWNNEVWALFYIRDARTHSRTVEQEIFHNHNIAAFNPIDITFTGYDTGQIDVNSNAGIIVDGALKNRVGVTNLNALGGSILQGDADYAGITGQEINLAAGTGIGAADAGGEGASPLNIELVNNGVVNAGTAEGDIRIHASKGDLTYGDVAGPETVSLSADMNIRGLSPDALIQGNLINLDARHGSIGINSSLPVRIDSGDGTGGLIAGSASDMFIREISGDLYLVSAESGSTDVSIESADGSIIDNNPAETVDERAKEGLLQAFWKSMELVGGDGAEASRDRTVDAYERNRKREYETYWTYRSRQDNKGTVYDKNFKVVLTSDEKAYYKNTLGWSDTEIADLEKQRTQEYHSLNTLYGKEGNSHDENWSYTVVQGSDEYKALTRGYAWTEDELSYALGSGILQEVSDTEIRVEDPNARGRNISLSASGSIGSAKTDVVIDLNKADGSLKGWKDLSEDEILAILTAERKDIDVVSQNDQKGTTAVKIKQHEDVDVEATGGISATAPGDIFLGSEEDMKIAGIDSGNDVIIKGQKAVIGAPGTAPAHIMARDLLIEAGDNSIGAENAPVAIALEGGLTARAGDEIHLREALGDMRLETIFAVNRVNLEARDNIFDFNKTGGLDIRTGNLFLKAGQSIGASGTGEAIDIGLDPGGILSASAGKNIYMTSDRNLTTGRVAAGGNIGLTGAQDIRVLSAQGGIQTQFGNVFIDAYHSILDGDVNDAAGITGQNIDLTVQTGSIGEAENSLEIDTLAQGKFSADAPLGVYVTETQGDIHIGKVFSETGGTSLKARNGSITLGEVNVATLAKLDAGKSITGTTGPQYNIQSADVDLLARNGDINMPAMRVSDTVTAKGTNITLARVDHSKADRMLHFSASSPGSQAKTVTVKAKSAYGVQFDHLDADFADIFADTINFKLFDMRIGTRGVFNSSRYKVILDNRNKAIQDSNAQLYALGRPVSLEFFSDRKFVTSADIVHYDDDFIVNTFSTENSINRFDGKIPAVTQQSIESMGNLNRLAFVGPVVTVEGYSEPLIYFNDASLGLKNDDSIDDEDELLLEAE